MISDTLKVNCINAAHEGAYLCVVIEGLTDCLRQAT